MPDQPLVSIIIPAYNAARNIEATLRSLLTQSWTNMEILVVDDGSTDDTARVVKNFPDKRIKYIYQVNSGCSGAKNTGLLRATGDFIQYLDADDLLSSNKIEVQVNALLKNPCKVAVCKTLIFNNEPDDVGKEIDTEFLYSTGEPFEFVLRLYGLNGQMGMIQPNAFLVSKTLAEKVGPYDESISPAPDEDGEYFCRIMLQSDGLIYTPEAINFYRKHPDTVESLSKIVSHRHAKGALRSLELKASHMLKRENSTRVKEVLVMHYASFIYQYHHLYKDLAEVAFRHIGDLNVNKKINVGGARFQQLSRIIGFKNAVTIKSIIGKLKNGTVRGNLKIEKL